jgi:Nif-specific regulatory protein
MLPMYEEKTDNSERNDELAALYQISKILTGGTGQKAMLGDILRVLELYQNMRHGTIMLVSPDNTELSVEAVGRPQGCESVAEVTYQRGEGITGRVLQTGEPAIIPRLSEEPSFCGRVHRRAEEAHKEDSFICVPIKLDTDTIGTLSIDIPLREPPNLEKEKWLLSIVASMIAYDVKNRQRSRLETELLTRENARLRHALGDRFRPENIIGNSKAMTEVYTKIQQVARADTTVLITGESGTGKELVASAIHYGSPRCEGPFVKVNCAALNEHLLESELFGHEKGAFTGAVAARIGRIEEAEGGTLFLDEIGDFSQVVQVKLLRVLQERQYERVGSNEAKKADVRVVVATNRDLEAAIQEGAFRQDLYYRIHVFPIGLPPLRQRHNDILLLANYFVERFAKKMNRKVNRISTSAINMMMAYHWPGNVRELENCIERAVLVSDDVAIHGHHLPPTLQLPAKREAAAGSLKAGVNAFEKDMIIEALKHVDGRISLAAGELGITSRMLRYKIKNLNIDYARFFKKKG